MRCERCDSADLHLYDTDTEWLFACRTCGAVRRATDDEIEALTVEAP